MNYRFYVFATLSVLLSGLMGCMTAHPEAKGSAGVPEVTPLVKSALSWDGERLPAYPQGQPEITILRITIPAGARLHVHHHRVINAGVLIRGQLTVVTADGKTLQLQAGDPIVEVVGTLHHGINRGKDPAEIIVVYAGIVDQPITVVEPQ